jgi:hypothetical protein
MVGYVIAVNKAWVLSPPVKRLAQNQKWSEHKKARGR